MFSNPKPRTLSLIFLGILTTCAGAQPTEKSIEWKASEVLPPAIVSGLNSQVLDPVENDGYLNIYRLKSKFGEMRVVSTDKLYQRVHEFDAIAQMEKLKGTQEFAKGVEAQAGKVVQGAANLVTDPVDTTKKVFSGIGRMFQNIGNAISGDQAPSNGNALADLSGFGKVERSYAKQFSVDPYSRNSYLQDTLKDVSRAGFLGGTAASLGMGGVGNLSMLATGDAALKDIIYTKSAQDLATFNSETLKSMGVSDDLIDLFLRNQNFTNTERAAIVLALKRMPKTQNRQNFIKFAVLTDNGDVAAFRRRQVEMYAAYDQKQSHIQEFRFLDQFAAARLEDGSLLLMAPLDHLLWTPEIANYLTAVNQQVAAQTNPPRKLLWFSGTASPLALKNLKQAGWQVEQKVADRLK